MYMKKDNYVTVLKQSRIAISHFPTDKKDGKAEMVKDRNTNNMGGHNTLYESWWNPSQ